MALSPDDYLVIFEPNQAQKALDLLLWQDTGRPLLGALVVALAKGAQLAEDTSFAAIAGSLLDSAEGATLDRIGEIVGETRGALSHESFGMFIGLRITANTAFPSEDTVFTLLASAVDPSTVASYLIDDGIVFVVTSDPFLPGSIASHSGKLIRDLRPAGMFVAVTEQEVDGAEIGTVATPGTLIGSIATPGPNPIGRLIYDGWCRPRPRRGNGG
jgi:hypothetical protein